MLRGETEPSIVDKTEKQPPQLCEEEKQKLSCIFLNVFVNWNAFFFCVLPVCSSGGTSYLWVSPSSPVSCP